MYVCLLAVILVVTSIEDLADKLSRKHGLTLHHVKLPEGTRVINGYSQCVYSALFDDNCQVVYFIWSHSMEKASKVTDPPVSELVRELVSRPHSATELKKVVFVQLGSKSTVPLSTMIHQFSLESSPSDEHFNVQECVNSIYDMARDLQRSDDLQRNDDVDAVDGATQRMTRTLLSEVTPTEPSPPRNDTPPPSSLPPSYDTAMNTGGLESRSMPAIGQSRIVEQLRVTESASVGNSPQIEHIMKAQLAAQQELVGQVRELRKTIGDTAEKHGDKVVAAIQGDRRTTTEQFNTINTNVEAVGNKVASLQDTVVTMDRKVEEVQGEMSTIKEKTEELQDTVEGVGTQVQELDDGLQDLSMLCSM